MIKATNLVKRFDELTALDSLNTVIEDGCICGLVGSNGAGKSTLLRLIRDRIAARADLNVFYMPQDPGDLLDMNKTPLEMMMN